jgi:hypothetical protein
MYVCMYVYTYVYLYTDDGRLVGKMEVTTTESKDKTE